MSLLDTLTEIRDDVESLTPEAVLEAATPKGHPLHDRFEWDNRIAGHQYRLAQAAQLLRVVRLPKDPEADYSLRAFVAVKGEGSSRAEYVPTGEAMADEFTRKLVLRDMEREWKQLKRRYEHLVEFAAMVSADIAGRAS